MCLQQVLSLIRPGNSYFLKARLSGHHGPINCFAIISEFELLASGGDDECVNIWDLKTFQRTETLTDSGGRWGQITCMIWTGATNGSLLCLGTGRGRLVAYRRKRIQSHFVEIVDAQIFDTGISVEAIAFDPNQQRLVTAGHNGSVKMFRLNKEGNLPTPLVALWNVDPSQAIPRSLHFLNKGEDLMIFHLESGELICIDPQTATIKYSKAVKTAIGNADLDEMEKNVVIDNIGTGYDIYPAGRFIPTHSLEVPTTRKHIRAVVFCENGQSVVGGSDHGKIYLFNLKSPQSNQVMTHGGQSTLIQAIASASSEKRHLIVAGSSENKSQICIWEKPTKRALQQRRSEDERRGELILLFTLLILNLALAITWKAWFPAFKSEFMNLPREFQNSVKHLIPGTGRTRQDAIEEQDAMMARNVGNDNDRPSISDILDLEDRILRKILRMPPQLLEKDGKLEISKLQLDGSHGVIDGDIDRLISGLLTADD
ncbi:hypothetical protein GALMADRAFT_148633 [Galerina marginata CBS 339.88]|uniref:Uncharacterized protein n=1 Tax=Galerina marginata (strain CBS 339.88) TaxID=685588 RepID=A0A067S415_GALM3|nr:hypothetical protein GALMADRAFT_148633 [Galerina marginata CBS 339.88]